MASSRSRRSVRKPAPKQPTSFVLPKSEWDKATELVRLFVATGWIENERAQSVLFISEPGSGKTELLERFAGNGQLQFASDLTVRGLYQVAKRARQGVVTHLVATEFQKFFMRKQATADNTLGTLCQLLEEGLYEVLVGDKPINFGGVQLGFIGAITHTTMSEKTKMLQETGFISRVSVIEWEMGNKELYDVLTRIGNGDKTAQTPVLMDAPQQKVAVEFPPALSKQFQDYVFSALRDHAVMRVFKRFRALAMASALLDGRDIVHARDVEHVAAFHDYWERMRK